MKRTIAFLVLGSLHALAQNAATPGMLHADPPTFHNLGFWWPITGDENRNARVTAEYRVAGESAWKPALPLLRIGGEQIGRDREKLKYFVPPGFAGSVLNLQPATRYEVRLTMADPDGVTGPASQTLALTTRKDPQRYPRGRTLHVYPPDWKGTKQEPAFTGILEAYYGAGLGDWSVVWEARVQPGDTILVHAGLYRPERLNYVDPLAAPFDGTFNLTAKATADKPITIQAAGDGEAIFDGAGNHILFDVMGTAHHIFEGLTFRNTDVAMLAGKKELTGATNLTVRNCRFEQIGFGIWTEYAGSREFNVTDNLFLGRDDRFRLIGWTGPRWGDIGPYPSHLVTSYYAVKVYGPGHVIAHNAVAYFHDALAISTYGTPESDPNRHAAAIDIYNNDMHMFNDDFVETDGGVRNIRVYQNRGVNAFHGGYSSQPLFGGPVYFFRNLLYHGQSGVSFKLDARPAGLLIYHNTIIAEQAVRSPNGNAHWRNNLFLGRDMPGRGIMTWANATPHYSSDYNGFRPNKGVEGQYSWLAPVSGGPALYYNRPEDWKTFRTLADFRAATGQEQHGLEVDYDIFERISPPDASPQGRHKVYHAMDFDFSLRRGAAAIDKGERLPTINDGFTGAAPDLGALEFGQPAPKYGPRWITWQPFYR